MSITYSVVVPMKNEEGNVEALISEIEPVMNELNETWELICIDDGSTDKTRTILEKLATEKTNMRVLVFSKNFGQSSAFDAGFRTAKGTFVITLDGDRQNDPRDIPKLIEAIQYNDLVCGHRAKRKDPWHKKITSFFANQIRSRVCRDNTQDTGCSLKVYRKKCLDQIKIYNGMHRFLPALFAIEGFRIQSIPVNHRERIEGKTKYNLWNRSFNTITDLFAVWWMRKRSLNYKIEKEIP